MALSLRTFFELNIPSTTPTTNTQTTYPNHLPPTHHPAQRTSQKLAAAGHHLPHSPAATPPTSPFIPPLPSTLPFQARMGVASLLAPLAYISVLVIGMLSFSRYQRNKKAGESRHGLVREEEGVLTSGLVWSWSCRLVAELTAVEPCKSPTTTSHHLPGPSSPSKVTHH